MEDNNRIFTATGTGIDHEAAMNVQDLYDEAWEREKRRRSAAIARSAMLGFAGMSLPRLSPKPERVLADFDRRQIQLAANKRQYRTAMALINQRKRLAGQARKDKASK